MSVEVYVDTVASVLGRLAPRTPVSLHGIKESIFVDGSKFTTRSVEAINAAQFEPGIFDRGIRRRDGWSKGPKMETVTFNHFYLCLNSKAPC